jgi:integrase
MSAEQLRAFLDASECAEPRHFPMFLTISGTGVRLGESFGLQWDDLDLSGKQIRIARAISGGHVETPKSGKGRTVDAAAYVVDVLKAHDVATKAAALKAGQPRAVWVFGSLQGTPLDRANVERPSRER